MPIRAARIRLVVGSIATPVWLAACAADVPTAQEPPSEQPRWTATSPAPAGPVRAGHFIARKRKSPSRTDPVLCTSGFVGTLSDGAGRSIRVLLTGGHCALQLGQVHGPTSPDTAHALFSFSESNAYSFTQTYDPSSRFGHERFFLAGMDVMLLAIGAGIEARAAVTERAAQGNSAVATREIVGTTACAAGRQVRTSGAAIGRVDATILQAGVTSSFGFQQDDNTIEVRTYGNLCAAQANEGSQYVGSGDSGGPVYAVVDNKAYAAGIIVGGCGSSCSPEFPKDKVFFYTPIGDIIEAVRVQYGLTLSVTAVAPSHAMQVRIQPVNVHDVIAIADGEAPETWATVRDGFADGYQYEGWPFYRVGWALDHPDVAELTVLSPNRVHIRPLRSKYTALTAAIPGSHGRIDVSITCSKYTGICDGEPDWDGDKGGDEPL